MEQACFCTAATGSASLLHSPSGVRIFANHVEGNGAHNLQMACLALQRSQDLLCKSSASAIKFVASQRAAYTFASAFFCRSKERKRNQACRCSAKHGSPVSEPAPFKHLQKNLDSDASPDAGDEMRVEEDDAAASAHLSPAESNGTMVGSSAESRLTDGIISDEVLNSGEGDQNDGLNSNSTPSNEGPTIAVKEPIYEVLEVQVGGSIVTKRVSRRLLIKTSGLRQRDIRTVDPSLWVTNAAPSLLIRDHAVLLNLGSLRAIASADSVLLFDYKSIGATAFLDLLLQRLNPDPGVPAMPFELEVVEAALLSRTQRLERRLMEVEPRVLSLLEVLPNRYTANVLEELRLSKQALVELGSKANALRQMLLELLESPQEIRRMTIMGRRCIINKTDGHVECELFEDKQLAHDEEEEMEMLLENYLQRCESCHGQAERLLDSAREMEDSIAVNLSSRRLEVSRLELLLQVGTFCSALGALVAGIFGMNLKSYLEENMIAFWLTSAGIILGGIVLFFLMYNHLKQRKIL